MVLDLEIGAGRDDALALSDGTPCFMKIADISTVENSNRRALTFRGWRCCLPESQGERKIEMHRSGVAIS
jgi:hypothetical protein